MLNTDEWWADNRLWIQRRRIIYTKYCNYGKLYHFSKNMISRIFQEYIVYQEYSNCSDEKVCPQVVLDTGRFYVRTYISYCTSRISTVMFLCGVCGLLHIPHVLDSPEATALRFAWVGVRRVSSTEYKVLQLWRGTSYYTSYVLRIHQAICQNI